MRQQVGDVIEELYWITKVDDRILETPAPTDDERDEIAGGAR